MKYVKHILNNFVTEETGQDLIEYAIVAAVLGLAAVASLKCLGPAFVSTIATFNKSLISNL